MKTLEMMPSLETRTVIRHTLVKDVNLGPADYLGDVMGDINKRRGRIMGTDTEGNSSIITAEVPLAEIKEYTMELRSLTRGSGKFASEFLAYEEVPFNLVDKIIADARTE